MTTLRLDFEDPSRFVFDARVVARTTFQGAPSIVLDQSAFYPESGGQPGDVGTLAALSVRDVQIDDLGRVHHLLDADASTLVEGQVVRGVIDGSRRRLHMALHTAQHMLSRALIEVADAETVSARLAATGCTIDVDVASLDDATLARAEALVNAVVEDDRPVVVFVPTPEALAALPLRRAPKVTDNVRVVDIGGFDLSPCGGTHCTRTAQVGPLTITALERYKGKMRVTFLAGRAAVAELTARARVLATLGRTLSAPPLEAPAAIERIRAELTATRNALTEARARYAAVLGEALVAEALKREVPHVVCTLEREPIETLRALASVVTSHRNVVIFAASHDADGTRVLVARGEGSTFDCGGWLKAVCAAHGGRGGGKAERAEGRLPHDVAWEPLAREMRS
jgi:alanyl-tRNA synthetase